MTRVLGQLGGDVGRWLDTYGRDISRAFGECRRADWLLRIAMSLGVDRKLVVLAAADAASLAVRRTQQLDLRPARCVVTALKWSRGESCAADAWASAFASAQAAQDIASESPLASEAALAAAAVGFACDPLADEHYYAQRAYAADAVEHAVRAYGLDRSVGQRTCLDAARERITLAVLTSAVSTASQRPPAPAF